ncbi:hypothetical protein FJT64_016902 [Amphibalanus amphitrite]|uniref:RNase H type-1 domain-containing protein n=1 Tax=Amphibalanus amphitrite TaxID=1232801 RepID=A0A6A4WXM6_AMPAM|nr:hypothetical protein FJT64_016902 [Amphibalanus amphitrite]
MFNKVFHTYIHRSAFYSCDPPWLGHRGGITFRVDLPMATRRSDPPAVCREAALRAIAELPHPDVTIWSDGSARGGRNRAAQALIQFHHLNREETVRAPAGAVCSSLRAELTAMREAFAAVAGLEDGELASTKSVRLLTSPTQGLGSNYSAAAQLTRPWPWPPRCGGC